MRKWLIAAIFVLGFIFIVTRFTEMSKIAELLQQANWYYFGLAVAVQILWFWVINAKLRILYRGLGIAESAQRIFYLATAANFVTIITPSGGMTGLAVYLSDARRRGHPVGRVMVACLLYILFDYFAILVAALAGFFLLARYHRLQWPELTAFGIVTALLVTIASLLYVGSRSTDRLAHLLAKIARGVNRVSRVLLRRPLLSVEQAAVTAYESADGMQALRCCPRVIIRPLLLAILAKGMMLVILMLMFKAFNIAFTPTIWIAGFSQSYLFSVVSPSPSTFGIVESLLTISLVSLGLSVEAATLATLGYRAITFWIPFFTGLVTFRLLARALPVKPVDSLATQPGKAMD